MLWLLKMIWYRIVRNMRPQLERTANLRLLQEMMREPSSTDATVGVMKAFVNARHQIAVLRRQCIEARWNDRQTSLRALAELVHELKTVMERTGRSAKHAAPMFLVKFIDVKDAIAKTHGTLVTEAARETVVDGHWSDFVEQSIKALESGESEMRCLLAALKYVIGLSELLDAQVYQAEIRSQGFVAALEVISAEKGLEIQFADMEGPVVPHLGVCTVFMVSGMFGFLYAVFTISHVLFGAGAQPGVWMLIASLPSYAIFCVWGMMWQRRLRLHIMRHVDAYRRVRAAAQE